MSVAWKSLSAHDFALKSSAQMEHPDFTQARSYEQILRIVKCIGDRACLLWMFVDAFVCAFGWVGGGSGCAASKRRSPGS